MKPAATRLRVTPIPGEPDRYFVQSQSRPDVQHVVDMAYVESPNHKPHPSCGCENVMAKGKKTCKHIEAVIIHVQKANRPDYTTEDFEPFPL